MLAAGGLIILLTFGAFVQNLRNKVTSSRLLLKALLWGIPLLIFHVQSSTNDFGEEALYQDALNDLLPAAYEAAVKEAGIEVVAQPTFDVVSMEKVKTGH